MEKEHAQTAGPAPGALYMRDDMGVAKTQTITKAGKQTKLEMRTLAAVCSYRRRLFSNARASDNAGIILTAKEAVIRVDRLMSGTAMPVKYPKSSVA